MAIAPERLLLLQGKELVENRNYRSNIAQFHNGFLTETELNIAQSDSAMMKEYEGWKKLETVIA